MVTAITSPEAEVTARVDRDTQSTQAEIKEINRLQAPEQRRYQGRFCPNPPNQEQETRQRTSPSPRQCQYCGYNHRRGDNCPAFGKRCRKCNKENHFSSVCRSTSNTRGDTQKRDNGSNNQRKNIKRTTEEDSPISSDDDYFVQAVTRSFQAKKIKATATQRRKQTVTVRLHDVDIHMEPDSGAEVNLMDEHQIQALLHRTAYKPTLEHCQIKLNTLQHPLHVKGKFETIIRNQTCGKPATFVVVKGRINSPPLLSKETLVDLGMLKIQPDGGLTNPNSLGIANGTPKTVKSTRKTPEQQEMDNIITKYHQLFEGIGKIADKKNNKEIYGRFHMKPEAIPVTQRPRPVPYHLQRPLKEWLRQGVEQDIFEQVPENEPVTWCSPLVIHPKPRFVNTPKEELGPHMIRASVDLRVPNKFMERSRVTQTPIVEDFIHRFHDCCIWTKMDLRQGYHQLALHPESRAVATFATPWGNYRPKRLVFGAKASQDLFDETMQRIFGDIPRCLNQRDDILIGARNWAEHNATLEAVLQRAEDFGITLNKAKCEFGRTELEFYGYRFSQHGLTPRSDKVKAIRDCSAPTSKSEVRSFLGMTGYLAKFIPRYASLTQPLRELTRNETKFHWDSQEQDAFAKLKHSISSDDTIAFFNPARPTMVRTEANYNEGLSAGLFQRTDKGWQPVHFISRTLTDTERRYSQTEKDALCVKWAKDRFSIYLMGAPRFTIVTAHKPLLPLFNKATAKLPPRIEKWVMDMQDVDYEMRYEPGKDEADPMDFLSRHPLPETGEDETERMIKSLTETEPAIVLRKIREATAQDCTLKKLSDIIHEGNWMEYRKDPDIVPFISIKDELYQAKGLIYRMNQIVLPDKLQKKMIKIAHEMGHFGKTKTKQMLRSKYWFPTMNTMVESLIEQCFECQVATKQHTEEPIKPTTIPQKPWEEIAIDFGGPYPDGHYNLVAIDKRTRYPEVEVTYSTSFTATQAKLKRMFGHHGIPQRIDSDNGPPFNSEEFAQFAEHEGFIHHRITPEHPRANGEAERFMQILNKTEQIAHLQGKQASKREIAVQDMLIAYRDTPHPATGVTPYEALYGRPIRTRLDHEARGETDQTDEDKRIDQRDKEYKKRMSQQRRNVKKHQFTLKDYVLLKQKKSNKWTTPFEPAFYVVTKIQGSSITIKRIKDGRELCRDASQLKLANSLVETDHDLMLPAVERGEKLQSDQETDDEIEDGEVEERERPPDIDQEVENELNNRERRERNLPVRLRDYVLS